MINGCVVSVKMSLNVAAAVWDSWTISMKTRVIAATFWRRVHRSWVRESKSNISLVFGVRLVRYYLAVDVRGAGEVLRLKLFN